jgi:hypothetical protein
MQLRSEKIQPPRRQRPRNVLPGSRIQNLGLPRPMWRWPISWIYQGHPTPICPPSLSIAWYAQDGRPPIVASFLIPRLLSSKLTQCSPAPDSIVQLCSFIRQYLPRGASLVKVLANTHCKCFVLENHERMHPLLKTISTNHLDYG